MVWKRPRYLVIEHETNIAERLVTISGQIAWDESTSGESFDLLCALKNQEGKVGSYVSWVLTAPDFEPEPYPRYVRGTHLAESPRR